MSQRITDKFVKAIAAPARGNKVYFDSDVSGFGVRVTANGALAFVFNYRAGARQRRMTIGGYPAWSVAAAREEAKTLRQRADRGADPMGDKHADRAAPTVADLCNRYIEEYLPRKRPSSQAGDKAMCRLHILPKLGTIKVVDASYTDIDRLHRSMSATPYQANRVLALLSKMFSLAIRWRLRADNPCKGVERFQEVKRETYLTGDQRAALLIAMQEHSAAGKAEAQTVQAFRLAMLTGSRIGEVLGARKEQFDVAAGKWTKPGATTKQKTTHHAVLNAPARQLVAEIMGQRGSGDYLFPSPADPSRAQAGYKNSWRAIRRRATVELWHRSDRPEVAKLVADLETALGRVPTFAEAAGAARKLGVELPTGLMDFRVHDLRHSFASEGAAAGLSLPMIGALLGHTNPATTARYAHLMDDPLRQAAEKIGSRMTGEAERTAS